MPPPSLKALGHLSMSVVSLMTALWTIHGRAVAVVCLACLSLAAPAASAAAASHSTHVDRVLARDDNKRGAFTEVRRLRAERERVLAAASAPAPAPERAGKKPARKGGAEDRARRAAVPPVGDYDESKPLDLPTDVEPGPARADAAGGSLGRTLFGLFVVVGLIYGLTHVLRRMRNGATGGLGGRSQGLKAVASIPLGPNRSIHLVRAGHEYLLVGAAEHGVVPLRTYTEDEARAAGLLDVDTRRSDGPPSGGPRVPSPSAAMRRRGWPSGPRLDALLDEFRARTVRR